MSKAFDSVNSNCLLQALYRIKIPVSFINIFEKLTHNRENIVLTTHGNTEPYKVEDRIDQGDIISPLLWRIFYDPLISKIAESKFDYKMKENWTSNLRLS